MSTTIKRVALVAVAALGLGVVSVAPSQAAAQLDSVTVSAASTTQVTTETLTATAVVATATLAGTDADTLTVTASIVSGPAYSQPILAFKESTTAHITASGSVATVNPKSSGSTVTQATGKFNVYLNAPTVAGTYVVKLTPTGGTNAVATTVSIVVSAKVYAAVSAEHSRVWMKTITDGAIATYGNGYKYSSVFDLSGDAAKDAFNVTSGTVAAKPNGEMIATLAIIPRNESGSATTLTQSPITVTVSGPGYVGVQGDLVRGKSITEGLTTSGADGYDPGTVTKSAYIFSDGTAGVTTVTVSMAGVVLKTLTINQVGTATALVFGTPSKTVVGVGETASVTVTGADALGTTTGAASVWVSSSDTSVATVNSTQASTVVITGVKSGSATITVRNNADATLATITKTLAIKVGALTAKTVALSFDNATPQPGEKVTVTVTATDASGNPVGDGTRALFTSAGLTTSLAVQGATFTASSDVALVGGKGTFTFYAPTGTGTLTLTATEGTATDSTTKAAITGAVTVINPAVDAATDAANEAAQAASDATDAALAAADAADAATTKAQEAVDAVATLSAQVSKLITALKAQITTLTNLVIKIQKKVRA